MQVYRVVVSNNNANRKGIRDSFNLLNTHHYDNSKDYIHFFKFGAFAKYFYKLEEMISSQDDDYILVADIPKEILNKYLGFGFYVYDGELIPIPEYAIPKEEFDSAFIVKSEGDPNNLCKKISEEEKFKEYVELVNNLKLKEKDINAIVLELSQLDFENELEDDIDLTKRRP